MSPATGLLGYRDGCCCLFTWETLSPVDLDTCSSRNKSKIVEHKTCIVCDYCTALQWKNIPVKNYAISATVFWDSEAILPKKSFVPVTRAELFLWKSFYHQYRDLGRKVRDFGNRGSPAAHLKKLIFFFFRRKERRCEISEIEPVQSDRAHMRRPPKKRLLRTPVGS